MVMQVADSTFAVKWLICD